ncbi:MAG: FAD-binding oxidoreductase, partial [Planctomycetota bacterium]|nr:FAD-binding oxidoreductase [Planctomycetota bacterium]
MSTAVVNAAVRLVDELTAIVGVENVLTERDEKLVYECDGYVIEKNLPDVVVFPRSTADVVAIVKLCGRMGVPFVPRGAGT